MNSGEIVARHYVTRKPLKVAWHDAVFTSVEQTGESPGNRWIAPALVDLQVNGFADVDFQQDDLSLQQLLTAVRGLVEAGCARFLLTLITDEWPRVIRRVRSLRLLRENHPELRAAIAGWHIEGPFLSAEPGFCGAHDPQSMRDPARELIQQLRDATGNDVVLITLAPERSAAMDAIQFASSLGIKISLGHTNAPTEMLQRAFEAGAVAFTHLGNACPRELDRQDNILWRVLDLAARNDVQSGAPGFLVTAIPDGIHVSPALFRIFHRVLGHRICYVSDAMSAAGAPPGLHRLGHLKLEVGADQIVRFPGGTHFAGSALRPIDGVFRAAAMLGCSWRETWKRFSEIPASLLGSAAGLSIGSAANFCVIDEVPGSASPLITTHVAARENGIPTSVIRLPSLKALTGNQDH